MSRGIPSFLTTLLHGTDPDERELAWDAFVARYSRLMLHTIRRYGAAHDDVMDRYAFVLEQLRADDHRRLRSWSGDGRSELTTWLVVVVQRLCNDHIRSRYGRSAAAGRDSGDARERRRRLADFVVEELQPELTASPADAEVAEDPELAIRAAELRESLDRALGSLDAADRLMLALRFRDGLSAARIARALSLPSPFHVYRRLNQLFDVLRRRLREAGIEDPVP